MKLLLLLLLFPIFIYGDSLEFGSYGRVGVSSNLDGKSGKFINIVSNGARIEKPSYQELWMKYDFSSEFAKKEGIDIKMIFTMAFEENYFHYNGDFSIKSAIRQFYIDIDNIFLKGLNIWVGSRMYRGDDIYLLDFWPLDNLNTFGAGVIYKRSKFTLKLHLGVNRIDQGEVEDPYQYAYYPVPIKGKPGSTKVLILDRQRYISSLNLIVPMDKLKFKLYGEFHLIGEGNYKENEVAENYHLPSDNGFVLGSEFTYHSFAKNSFLHLFIKYARGMAAYGEFGIPFGSDENKKTTGANEFLIGSSFNFEKESLGVMFGTYYRYFEDADNNIYDDDDYNEAIFDLRLSWYFTDIFHLDFESIVEFLKLNNLDSETNTEMNAQLFKFAIMPTISPNGRGAYTQPKIRLIYTFTYMNEGAEHLYEKSNPIRNSINHYLGVSAEWWFNSI